MRFMVGGLGAGPGPIPVRQHDACAQGDGGPKHEDAAGGSPEQPAHAEQLGTDVGAPTAAHQMIGTGNIGVAHLVDNEACGRGLNLWAHGITPAGPIGHRHPVGEHIPRGKDLHSPSLQINKE
jgi:hypothetical protein